jgi:two-component system, NtrC family, sensor kinase
MPPASEPIDEALRDPLAGAAPMPAAVARGARLDFFRLVSRRGGGGPADPCLETPSMRALVDGAAAGQSAVGADVLSRDCLAFLDPQLPAVARIPLVSGNTTDGAVSSALALVAAVPVERGGRRVGTAYGGIVLNRRTDIVDRVKLLVYGEAQSDGREIGSASILMGDVRVATSARNAANERAIGTRASAHVSAAVLGAGQRWHGRARVVDDWCIAAYEPIRNHAGDVVGMLYVGMLEAPILAVRTDVMLTFLVVCVLGLAIVFALTYLITRRIDLSARGNGRGHEADRRRGPGCSRVGRLRRRDWRPGRFVQRDADEPRGHQARARGVGPRTLADKVRERTEELVTVQEQMARSEKLASIGRLAAGVAHSINNPLGGILSLSMLGVEECRDPALRADLETIARQACGAARSSRGCSTSRGSPMPASPAPTSTRSSKPRCSSSSGRRCSTTSPSSGGSSIGLPAVLVNPSQLQDALTNLLVNAVDAMESGGTLTVETASTGSSLQEVLVRVADTGSGIAEEHMPYLFEPFFTTKRVGRGTGLGLAIVHGVVTRARGRIAVRSSPAGTTFTIHLPIAPRDASAEEDVDHEMAGPGAGEPAGGR